MKATAKKPMAGPATIKLPDTWRSSFRQSALALGFRLNLTKAMLEMLCAVADGVKWDRSFNESNVHVPDNIFASANALEKRGLIMHCSRGGWSPEVDYEQSRSGRCDIWRLTPAGELVVQLVTLAGMFEVADAAAANGKSRRATR